MRLCVIDYRVIGLSKRRSRLEQFTAIVNMAVADFVGARLVEGLFSNRGFTEFHAASTEIKELTMDDAIALAAARKLQPVIAKIRKRAVIELRFVDAFAPDGARHADGSLGETANVEFFGVAGLFLSLGGKYHSV